MTGYNWRLSEDDFLALEADVAKSGKTKAAYIYEKVFGKRRSKKSAVIADTEDISGAVKVNFTLPQAFNKAYFDLVKRSGRSPKSLFVEALFNSKRLDRIIKALPKNNHDSTAKMPTYSQLQILNRLANSGATMVETATTVYKGDAQLNEFWKELHDIFLEISENAK